MELEKLKQHFTLVKNSSLFKEFYKNEEESSVLPLEKHVLRKVLKDNFSLQKESKGVYLVRSGGSSSKPLIFPVDIKENLYQRSLLAKELVKYGMFSSKTIALNLFSYKGMYRTAAILDDILERCDATTISLGASSSFELVYNTAKQFKATILMGTPSKLVLFANYLMENNLELEVNNLMYAGEFLLKSHAELLKKVFRAQKIYSLYGSAETGIWGWSTYSEITTSYEILDDIVVEIEKPDKEGNGTLVVTNLLRKRFPVFRYLMGDIGKLIYEEGKRVLVLKSRESKSFSIDSEAYFLNDFDWLYEEINRYQIQLRNTSDVAIEIEFLLVEAPSKMIDKNQIRKKLQAIFQIKTPNITLTINAVKESDLYVNNTTSKTPLIVDFRN
ncbi:hypothetical protein [uncultured Tenacibaculum sp.]|uniref:hypothetical protein n=1 Tax=uncultured Tenacibaculum sp. TaxID=174713 RepID=UPI00261170C8|nr:hypothetical protein [uncultured Tenacibaculum sp.]